MPIGLVSRSLTKPGITPATATPASRDVTTGSGNVDTLTVGSPTNAVAECPVPVRKVGGLPEGFDANRYGAKMYRTAASEGMMGEYNVRPRKGAFLGYGDITRVAPTQDGFVVDVNLYTQSKEEAVLILEVPLFNKATGELTFLNLDVLTDDRNGRFAEAIPTTQVTDPVSGKDGVWSGRRTYAFSLPQINAYLRSSGLNVQVKPGDRLCIAGLLVDSGHRVMNAAANAFQVPRPLANADQPLSPTSARITNVTQQSVKAENLPLDLSVKLPRSLLSERIYTENDDECFKVGEVIEGEITTRLESEYKGAVTEQQMNSMLDHANELVALSEKAEAGDKKARRLLDGLLGEGMVLRPVMRHWLCEDGQPLGDREPETAVFQRDEHGRPRLDPMLDAYSDDDALTFARRSGAVRVRGNAQKKGHAEFKLTGGRLDGRTGIRQRVETGISMKPNVAEVYLTELFKHIRDNPQGKLGMSPLAHVVHEAQNAGLADALMANRTRWAEVTQLRHKFELKNTVTGTSAELSLDTVQAKTVRSQHQVDGKPQERTFYVIETELDHLQINSSHVSEMPDAKTRKALVDAPTQQAWMDQAKAEIAAGTRQLEILAEPQLHGLHHVEDGTFRQTESYKAFETMQDKLLAALCDGFRPGPARQKSAHFAELLGLIPPETSAV